MRVREYDGQPYFVTEFAGRLTMHPNGLIDSWMVLADDRVVKTGLTRAAAEALVRSGRLVEGIAAQPQQPLGPEAGA